MLQTEFFISFSTFRFKFLFIVPFYLLFYLLFELFAYSAMCKMLAHLAECAIFRHSINFFEKKKREFFGRVYCWDLGGSASRAKSSQNIEIKFYFVIETILCILMKWNFAFFSSFFYLVFNPSFMVNDFSNRKSYMNAFLIFIKTKKINSMANG